MTGISNGMVNVSYTVTNGCATKSATASIVIISDEVAASKPLLYPNPNNGTFQYEFVSNKDEQLVLTVTDVTGRIVYTLSISATTGANFATITLPSGIPNASLLTVHLINKNTKYPVTKITVTE